MIIELRAKSQITIPKDIVKSLDLSIGDQLEIYEQDGLICIVPVVVYPKGYIEALAGEVAETQARINTGEQPVFETMSTLLSKIRER